MFVQALSPNTHTIVNRVEKMFDHPARHRTEQLFCCAAQDKLRSICFIADCIYRQWALSAAPWLKNKTKKNPHLILTLTHPLLSLGLSDIGWDSHTFGLSLRMYHTLF